MLFPWKQIAHKRYSKTLRHHKNTMPIKLDNLNGVENMNYQKLTQKEIENMSSMFGKNT